MEVAGASIVVVTLPLAFRRPIVCLKETVGDHHANQAALREMGVLEMQYISY